MVNNLMTPNVKVIRYQVNPDSKYYELTAQPPGFNKLPKELQVQDSQSKPMIERGALQVIQGRILNKKKTFFTGMRPTPGKNTFFGDDGYSRPQKPSFCLFQFSKDATQLTIHYFPGFMPLKPIREQFIQTYLETLK